jgi:hypothetical protein
MSLRAELQALDLQAVISGEEAKRVQSLIEQSEKAEAATQQTLNSLRGEQLNRELAEHLQQDTRVALYPLQPPQLRQDFLPTFIYSYKQDPDQLHRTNAVTGEYSSHHIPSYKFKPFCCWSEVPGGSLLITGGGHPAAVREVVKIDVGTFEVSFQPPMLSPRREHAAVYHTPHLYILGGFNLECSKKCERYACSENRWEALPPLPRACYSTSGVVVENSLYALGGSDSHGALLDLVQKLSLESLTWEIMQFRLPYACEGIPCFQLRDTEVYLVVKRTLCSSGAGVMR